MKKIEELEKLFNSLIAQICEFADDKGLGFVDWEVENKIRKLIEEIKSDQN